MGGLAAGTKLVLSGSEDSLVGGGKRYPRVYLGKVAGMSSSAGVLYANRPVKTRTRFYFFYKKKKLHTATEEE